MRLAIFGGIYNNYLALEAAIRDSRRRGAERLYCLGDLGAFGPQPDRVFPLLEEAGVVCIRGNYDDSIGHDLDDCQCGYTDPRDNHFAQISYDYTYKNTSDKNRHWLRDLPRELRFELDGIRFLLCHGSPRQTNEFLWESTTSTHFLDKLARDNEADVILGTHTGIHWQRELNEGRRFVNVGVLGRPENDGRTNVWYAVVSTGREAGVRSQGSGVRGQESGEQPSTADPKSAERRAVVFRGQGTADGSQGTADGLQSTSDGAPPLSVEFVPLDYDHHRLAREMREEKLPEEFVKTILTGWWTTCLEVLPSKERRTGRW